MDEFSDKITQEKILTKLEHENLLTILKFAGRMNLSKEACERIKNELILRWRLEGLEQPGLN